jgi:hypothetical protein
VAVLERKESVGEWDGAWWAHRKELSPRLLNLHRLPLDTPYPNVAAHICRVMRHPQLKGRSELVVDGTGVGRPVVDIIRAENLHCPFLPVMITCGTKETTSKGYYHVPKRDLITRVQILLQQDRLRIAAKIKDAPVLVKEMTEMQVKVTPSGNELFAAREGKHDDLVFAVALACWLCHRRYPKAPEGREAYCVRGGVSDWERGVRKTARELSIWDGLL